MEKKQNIGSACILLSERECGCDLKVGGLVPLTTIDFPDHLACVIFTQGCPLRCGYCQNTHLLERDNGNDQYCWANILSFLHSRQGILDAVVISGGEPLIQPDVVEAVATIKALGFKVGLHTAGVNPGILAKLISDLDWVGLDVKAPEHRYLAVTGRSNLWLKNQACLELLLGSGIGFECRTTVDWRLLSPDDLLLLAEELSQKGVQTYAVQVNHSQNCFDAHLQDFCPSPDTRLLQQQLGRMFEYFHWRE